MEAILFAGRNALDDQSLRSAVLRIPEVGIRIREAQKLIDEAKSNSLDLFTFILSPNENYLKNINLKSLASAVVQIGLFDRYCRMGLRPRFIVGTSNSDSAARVCAGDLSLSEMIEHNAELMEKQQQLAVVPTDKEPVLSGVSLTEYTVFQKQDDTGEFATIGLSDMDFVRVIKHLIEKESVKRFVNIGPGDQSLVTQLRQSFEFYDIEVSESVDLDPMLTWFWRELVDQKAV